MTVPCEPTLPPETALPASTVSVAPLPTVLALANPPDDTVSVLVPASTSRMAAPPATTVMLSPEDTVVPLTGLPAVAEQTVDLPAQRQRGVHEGACR